VRACLEEFPELDKKKKGKKRGHAEASAYNGPEDPGDGNWLAEDTPWINRMVDEQIKRGFKM
jgi:hypothetical protein